MIDIIYKINKLINEGGITKTKLSEDLGVERKTLNSWCKTTEPKLKDLVKIANYFNLPITYFFDENENSKGKEIHTTIGDRNISHVQGNVSVQEKSCEEKDKEIEYLKKIIADKELMIKILLKNQVIR